MAPMPIPFEVGAPVRAQGIVPMLTPSRTIAYRDATAPLTDADRVRVALVLVPARLALCSVGTPGVEAATVASTGLDRGPPSACTSTATWLPSVRPEIRVLVPGTCARTTPS